MSALGGIHLRILPQIPANPKENDDVRPPFSTAALMSDVPRESEGRRFVLSPSWIALGLSLFGVFWQVGVTSQRVNENSRRIEILENADRIRGDAVGRIDARTARIEATLDIITRGGIQRPLSSPLPSPDQPGGIP